MLSIHSELATESSLARLRDLPDLQELRLLLSDLSPQALRHLSGLTKLSTLEVRNDRLDAEGCEHLSKLGELRSLTLITGEFNGDGLSHFAQLSNLTRLGLGRSEQHWSEIGLKQLATLTQLRELIISGDDDTLEQIAQLPKLQTLSVTGGEITDRGFRHLTALRELRELRCWKMPVTFECLEAISQIRTLDSLSLNQTSISRDGIDKLGSLPLLRTISIQRTKPEELSADGIAEFRTLKNLRSLSITAFELTTEEISALGKLTQLQELTVATRIARPSDLSELKAKLKNCRVVFVPEFHFAFRLGSAWLVLPEPE